MTIGTSGPTDYSASKNRPVPSLLILVAASLIGEQLFGLSLGFISVTLQYQTEMANCTAYTTSVGCLGVKRSHCIWDGNSSACLFPDTATTNCGSYQNMSACKAAPEEKCTWQAWGATENDGVCQHIAGWSASHQGLFAACIVFGAAVGCASAARVLDWIGRKKSMSLAGASSILAHALVAAAWDRDIYWLLIVGRVVVGYSVGIVTCVTPMYIGEMAPRHLHVRLGAMFQLSYAFAVALEGAVGMGLDPARFYHSTEDPNLELRFQLLLIPTWFFSVATIILGCLMPESYPWLDAQEKKKKKKQLEDYSKNNETTSLLSSQQQPTERKSQNQPHGVDDEENSHQKKKEPQPPADVGGEIVVEEEEEISCSALARCFVFTTAMATALQFTGNSAVISYTPQIAKSLGIPPFFGNFLVALWNFLMAAIGASIAHKIKRPVMTYRIGTILASLGCGLVGVGKFPNLISDVHGSNAASNRIVSVIGMAIFIFAFQALIACMYYMLAQGCFPGKYRGIGCSYAIMAAFGTQLIVFYSFPPAVQLLSGGPAVSDQSLGLALVFFFFCGLGNFVALVQYLARPPDPQQCRDTAASGALVEKRKEDGAVIDYNATMMEEEGGGDDDDDDDGRAKNSKFNNNDDDDPERMIPHRIPSLMDPPRNETAIKRNSVLYRRRSSLRSSVTPSRGNNLTRHSDSPPAAVAGSYTYS